MQKSFELRTCTTEDYEKLKKLWALCFDDEAKVIDNFFSKTVTPENVVATFEGGGAVNAMYLLDSEIKTEKEKYNALYIYAVCTDPAYRGKGLMKKAFAFLENLVCERNTDYLFLVPASDSLFKMYENLGFKTGFTYNEEVLYKTDAVLSDNKNTVLTYEHYIKLRESFPCEIPLATLKEKGFNSFYSPVGDTVKCLCNNRGYAVYETENGKVTVHELFGEKTELLNTVFNLSGKDTVTLRKPTENGCGVPFGMYRAFGDVPEIKNAFFGIPYGV